MKSRGRFGEFGGQFVPETLMPALEELARAYEQFRNDEEFQRELAYYLKQYAGRPTPLYFAKRLTEKLGGAKIYLKREDLLHTGAHKINNTIGQVLLAKRMGKRRVIAETGAGQHGVATATAAAMLGLGCDVYMGTEDVRRQALNVSRMELLGAKVIPVNAGSKTLKDAINEALRDYIANSHDTHYVLGTVCGPHPYPTMVRDFQSVIGREAREQILEIEGRLPDELVACVGGGSNSIGLFYPFLGDEGVRMTGVEAGGEGIESGRHASRFSGGSRGVLHGMLSYVMQDENGQITASHSVAAGLDYPSVGPQHAQLKESGRVRYAYATDDEALRAFHTLSKLEGILPALESAHAIAGAMKLAPNLPREQIIIVNLSGRGDKDINEILRVESRVKT